MILIGTDLRCCMLIVPKRLRIYAIICFAVSIVKKRVSEPTLIKWVWKLSL